MNICVYSKGESSQALAHNIYIGYVHKVRVLSSLFFCFLNVYNFSLEARERFEKPTVST